MVGRVTSLTLTLFGIPSHSTPFIWTALRLLILKLCDKFAVARIEEVGPDWRSRRILKTMRMKTGSNADIYTTLTKLEERLRDHLSQQGKSS